MKSLKDSMYQIAEKVSKRKKSTGRLPEYKKQEKVVEKRRDIIKNKIKKEEKSKNLPYWPNPYFMNSSELDYFHKLEKLLGNENYYIIPQVHLSHILNTNKTPEGHKYNVDFNRINVRSVDFVIFTKPEFKFKLAIELDGPYHDKEYILEKDAKIESIMENAGLPLIRVQSFDVDQITFYL